MHELSTGTVHQAMRPRIDVADLYAKALRVMPALIDGQPPVPVPPRFWVTLDALLGDDADI